MSDAPETHAVLVARRHVHDVADAYEAIGDQLTEAGRRSSARTQPTSRPPVDLHLLAVRQEIDAWATWAAHVALDARDEAGQPWTPPTDSAVLLHEIADEHLGAFLRDPLEAAEFMDAAKAHAQRARATAWPSGARWIWLGVPCAEIVADDEVSPEVCQRVLCGGEYRMWMLPEQDVLGDMVCHRDGSHRITPSEWQRAMRRRPVDEAAAARLARTLRLAGRAVEV